VSVARKLVLAGIAGVAVLASGCSTVIGADGPQPGVAAKVGDAELSVSDADDITDAVCAAQEQNPQAQATTRLLAEQGIIAQWVTAQAARELADDQGISVDAQPFDRSQIPGFDKLSDDEQDVVGAYADDISYLQAVGSKLKSDKDGLDLSGVDVTINPRYDISVEDDRLKDVSNDLSAAVSDESVAGSAKQPTTDQLASLPDSQVCGTKPQPSSASPSQPPIPVPQG
jgi:peptidyl-prolyl cis-trans isomerase SurA